MTTVTTTTARKTKTRAKTVAKIESAPTQPAQPQENIAQRLAAIATAAYYKAEERGFITGFELDDWLAAEMEYEAAVAA
ncbi:DUF2934 domain-containing protein [Propionivibrio limicola]|uniref:DUF2934 domain-containing protein n=1 Tax=Propionivibrio limicola TaxID=167645 RepID=UPI00129166F3|nr:DUF2934 domain-containing protein [Propionivibrio limicola]